MIKKRRTEYVGLAELYSSINAVLGLISNNSTIGNSQNYHINFLYSAIPFANCTFAVMSHMQVQNR